MGYTHTLNSVHLICTPMDSGGHVIRQSQYSNAYALLYGTYSKHLKESLSYIVYVTPFDGTEHIY